ncbi:MAG: KTSC domain-containing protein, partial [Burkholderiales bacterium]
AKGGFSRDWTSLGKMVNREEGFMERKSVNSSTIRSVGYELGSQTLEIEFTSGSIYQYSRVSPEIHRKLIAAPTIGSYFKNNIEDEFTAKRIR